MIAIEVSQMPVKIIIDGDERETLIDPQAKKIDRMGRVYIDRNLAEQRVLIVTIPLKPGDREKWVKIGRD